MSSTSPNPDGADDQLAAVLTVAMAQSKEEYDRAERLENKFRALVTTCGFFFAVVQAATVNLIRDTSADHAFLAFWIALCAVLAASSYVAMLSIGRPVWELRNRQTIDGAGLHGLVPFALDGRRAVTKKLITSYADIVTQRQGENAQRADAYAKALPMAAGVVALLFVELALSFGGAVIR